MKRDQVYLNHILDSINKIEQYTKVGKKIFFAEQHWQDATIRQLEIIGEATKRISNETREANSDIGAIWEIASNNLPSLKMHIEKILSNFVE